jgi:hypothetical protein
MVCPRTKNRSEAVSKLRQRAEKLAGGRAPAPENGTDSLPEEAHKVIHELLVHQIELEL